ncbi:hypothetical protein Tco_1452988 [Tanacetum coccineum]
MSFLIPRICDNEEQANQNAEEYEDERESNDIRDRCRSALHDQEIELEKYKKYENCQLEKEEVERKLKDTLGLLAHQIFQSDEALKTQAFENFQFKEKNVDPVPSSYTGQFHCGNGTAKNRATVLASSIGLHWPVPSWQWNRRYRAIYFGKFLNRRSCADFCIRDQALRFTCSKYLSSHEDLTTDLKSAFTIIVNQNVCHIVLGAFG